MSYLNKKTIRDVDLQGKKVLARVEFNVPIENGVINDDTRMVSALPTIRFMLEQGAAVILMCHLGRPKGEKNLNYTLRPVAEHLAQLLGQEVIFAEDCIGAETEKLAADLKPGQVMLLENVRFYKEEEKNDPAFAKKLASLADIYVDDAFGSAHRAHASTVGVTEYLPAVGGFLLEKEIKGLGRAIENPAHPYIAIIGGAKVSDKIMVLENLLKTVDFLLIGGGMAHTFQAAKGYNMQESLVEKDKLAWAKEFLETEAAQRIMLPVDLVAAAEFDANAEHVICKADEVPEGWQALDIGPETIKKFTELVKTAATIVWNGPLGVFEMDAFAKGTLAIAEAVAASNAFSIIGGGDSVSAIHKAGVVDQVSHISTGGGASLEFLEGKVLPGIAALNDK